MNDPVSDDRLSGAGAAFPLTAGPDDRLDAALAFFLAFSVLGAVWLYAAKPWGSVSSDWLTQPAVVAEPVTAVPVTAPVTVEPAVAAPEPVRPLDASVPGAPLPMVMAPAMPPAVAVPEAPPAPVVEAPAAPIVAAAPVVEEPAVVASAPAPVAAVDAPKGTAPTVVIRENIQFALNSAAIPEADKARLDEVAKRLAADPRTLQIAGHTDNSGKRGTNTVLSLKRAQSVRDYLVARGASADRLSAVGVGPDRPIADNKTEAGRAKNRRIDITE